MPFHPIWLAVILVVVLIIFGPGRLPELGGAVGKAMREFRKATTEITNEMTSVVQSGTSTPSQPTPPAQPASQESSGSAGSQSEATSPKS